MFLFHTHAARKAAAGLFIASALFVFPSLSIAGGGLGVKERLEDFTQLQALIKSQYGPFEMKQRAGIVKWDDLNKEFEEKVRNAKTNQEFYSAIHEYIARFQDGHFVVRNPNVGSASVPLNLDLIGGKVLISYIDRKGLPKEKFDFEVGDEIVEVNKQAVQAVLDDLSRFIPSGSAISRRRKASWAISSRRSSVFALPKEEKLTLSIRRGTSGLVQSVELPWSRKGAALDEELLSDANFHLGSSEKGGLPRHWDARQFGHSLFTSPIADRRYSCNAESRIKLPEGVEWVMKEPIAAYTYPTPKGKVGYIRIPDYYPTNSDGEISAASVKSWFEKLRFIVKKMEASTVGMVIDQDHNCGGSVALVEQVVSLFLSKPEKPWLFSFRASKATYLSSKEELNLYTKDTIGYERAEAFVKLLETTLKAGRGGMTPITPITGIAEIAPSKESQYTKPVVVLIDEMSGSGGDGFPALMKGYGRAKLFGRQTEGLGGSVTSFPALNHSQLKINMTVSLFFQPDGSLMENNGAMPDREYLPTRDDVLYDYEPYRRAYTEYLLEQIP
jgi:hypothetical protein